MSSTYEDLKDSRETVRVALQRLGVHDVAMEIYTAGPERPLDRCLEDVAASDLYVGIFAWRYGYVPPGYDRSITELEYRHALETGKDVLIFLLDEDAPWPRKFIDRDSELERIEALRGELTREHTCDMFKDVNELAGLVSSAVGKWHVALGHPDGRGGIPPEQLNTYFERLQQQYRRLDLDALTPPQREEYLQIALRDVFVEPSVREDAPPIELPKDLWQKLMAQGDVDENDLPSGFDMEDVRAAREAYEAKPPRSVLEVIGEQSSGRLVLLGDPGAGKSTLARFLVVSLCSGAPDERLQAITGHLPLLIELRSYSALQAEGECTTFIQYLDYLWRTEGLGLDAATLDRQLRADTGALVIFDGLDEIFDPERREAVARQIAGFAGQYKTAAIVVTSRIIGYRRGTLADAGFTHHTLQDLSDQQIGDFLESWYTLALHDRPEDVQMRKERLEAAIGEFPAIRDLAGNPLLLTILAIIGKHQELPRERWKVYDHAATVLVEHWDINRHLRDSRIQADFIGEDDKKELLRRVAYRMQAGTGGLAGNYILGEELQGEFEAYLVDRYRRDPADAKTIATAMIGQFRERNFILSRYGPEVYGFVHRAFLEHFCADAFVWRFEKSQELSIDELRDDVFGGHWSDPSWREVLRLIAGRLADSFAGELIDSLVRLNRPWPLVFGSSPPTNIALAAQCLTEIRNLSAVAPQARAVMHAVINLLEHSVLVADAACTEMIEADVIPAAAVLGPSWPGADDYRTWYRTRGSRLAWDPVSALSTMLALRLHAEKDALRRLWLEVLTGVGDLRLNRPLSDALAEAGLSGRELQELWPIVMASQPEYAYDSLLRLVPRVWAVNPAGLDMLSDVATRAPLASRRRTAIEVLAHAPYDDEVVLPVLRQAAEDNSDEVRGEAMAQLGRRYWDTEDVRDDLLARAHAADASAIVAIQRLIGERPGDSRVVEALESLVWSLDLDKAPALFYELASFLDPALLRRLAADHSDLGVRAIAVQMLTPDPSDAAMLLRLASEEEDGDRRARLLESLVYHFAGAPEVWDLVRPFLEDSRGGSLALNVLLDALDSHWPDEPELRRLLIRLAVDGVPPVRARAGRVLARRWPGDGEVLDILRGVLRGDVPFDWTHIQFQQLPLHPTINQLAESWVGQGGALALLREVARAGRTPELRADALVALARAWPGDRDAGDVAIGAARGLEDPRTCAIAAYAIAEGWPDHPNAQPAIFELLSSPSTAVRRSAIDALLDAWPGDPGPAARLRRVAEDDDDDEVRSAAFTALASAWLEDGATRAFLRTRVKTPGAEFRVTALQHIGRQLLDDGDGFAMMREILEREDDEDLRLAALWALGTAEKRDDAAFALLRRISREADPPAIRQAAIQIMTSGWSCDPTEFPDLHGKDGVLWTSAAYGPVAPPVLWDGRVMD